MTELVRARCDVLQVSRATRPSDGDLLHAVRRRSRLHEQLPHEEEALALPLSLGTRLERTNSAEDIHVLMGIVVFVERV